MNKKELEDRLIDFSKEEKMINICRLKINDSVKKNLKSLIVNLKSLINTSTITQHNGVR